LPEIECQRLFQQVISALAYCQRRHVCHRDLKPENILLDASKNAKVADFGLASVVAPGAQVRTCVSHHICSTLQSPAVPVEQ
jgi:serine/threonine-protein kinase HSL1, negative regulator of Swe1 kinase